jgi:hypothetical protein
MLGCVPSENVDPVGEDCGVFVSSSLGKAGNDGLKGTPFATIQAALDAKKGTKIYVCAEEMAGSVTLSSGVTMYGGLDCHKGWAYVGGKTKSVLKGEADKPALVIGKEADGAAVEDFSVQAADATVSGGSSIGVIVEKATVTLSRCAVSTGDAKDGDAGSSGGPQAAQAEGGKVGGDAGAVGMGSTTGGNGGQNNVCSLKGGNGGDGGAIPSGDGGDGTQGDTNQGGAKGSGDTGSGCSDGIKGGNGMSGSFGVGAKGIGSIDAIGYHGADGQTGQDGTNGKSGGGGGGSKAAAAVHGAGGGGGGAGGCAGKLGTGGKAGGSSIALVSLGAKVTLSACLLTAGKGGNGGAGGEGQNGQLGGKTGDGGMGGSVAPGCNGGAGGKGGNGGNGGGAQGGHSFAIAVTGSAPTLDAATQKAITFGAKGVGGPGGNMDADMNHGEDGMAATCWDFAGNKSCL